MNLSLIKQKNYFFIIFALIFTILSEYYVILVEHSTLLSIFKVLNYFSMKHIIVFLLIYLVIFKILLDDELRIKVLNSIYNYRIVISLLIILICVVFQIHGSSINELNVFNVDHNTILGISRAIRTDEFNVNTMLAFSQYMNDFGYFSSIPRSVATDMFFVYGQPVWDIATLFRPFNIGYLFLSQGMGLSFFWVGRLVILFLVSFEMGMLITNKNKALSLAYAFLITFSPIIQWWFAVNGLVEQLIFGQLAVLLINFYLNESNYKKKIIISLSFVISIGTYLFTMYPSWEIPFAYVFLILSFWIILKNKEKLSFNKKDFIIIGVSLILLILLILNILNKSFESIQILMHTSYPSGEVFNGGTEPISTLFNYVPSIFYAITDLKANVNLVELSFIDFFPAPLILLFIVNIVQKSKDKLLWGLLFVYVFLMVLYFVPLPEFFNHLILRQSIRTPRLLGVISFVNILILIRSLADFKRFKNQKYIAPILGLILSSIAVYVVSISFNVYLSNKMIIVLFIIYLILFTLIFLASHKKNTLLVTAIILITLMGGFLVNPIDQGVDVVYDSNYMQEVSNITQNDPNATWLVNGLMIDSLLPMGTHTLNSVNIYPNLDLWKQFDSNGELYPVYNRYAHIVVDYKNNENTTMNLLASDIILLSLNVNDLEKLNVSYISSPDDLEKFSNENITFNRMYEENNYKIYNVNYLR